MTQTYPPEGDDEPVTGAGYRSYEVFQRERVGETTNLVNPRDLISDDYLLDPFTVPGVLRENYPCFRDWVGNRFWVTRYDDVTSVFVDDANYEGRRLGTAYGGTISGRDLGSHRQVEQSVVDMVDASLDMVVARALDDADPERLDVVSDVVDRVTQELFTTVVGSTDEAWSLVGSVKAGAGWDERARIVGVEAFAELRLLIAAQLADRRGVPAGDMLSVFSDIGAASDDVAVTLLEMDLATLPASMANLWCLLLTNPEQLAMVRSEPRLMKFAYLEALRHSPPIPTADRFARHEVERFGRLLPAGALVHLSAAAANRDPRQFEDPDRFDVARKDLCQREPRGQFRADGLPAGIAFGHGKPSRRPAVPRDAPRSRYAVTRDIAVATSLALLDRFPALRLADGTEPIMSLDRLGGTYRCRHLPVVTS